MRTSKHPLFFLAFLVALAALPALGQRASDRPRASPNATISETIGVTEVTISYGRPGVKGRNIWGELVPYDRLWRTGANEATTISFSTDVLIEGQKLAAGTYALFTIPDKNKWTIVFNKNAKQWGAFGYEALKDALRVEVQPQAAEHAEWMSFSFTDLSTNSVTVVLRWEKLALPFRIQVAEGQAEARPATPPPASPANAATAEFVVEGMT